MRNSALHLSRRASGVQESVTLKLNARAVKMAEEGRKVYNLTAGQLPFRTLPEFVELIKTELNFIRSFQYPPVPGLPELRQKIFQYFCQSRGLDSDQIKKQIWESSKGAYGQEDKSFDFSTVICNGAKHCLSNIFGALLDPGDEVIILTPYWVSYPEMVKFCDGEPIVIESSIFDVFVPSLDDIKKAMSAKTKVIVLNSPNNPTGTHYSEEWMKGFANLMAEHPEVAIISDEIYYEIFYFDPKPKFFYHFRPELLARTIIVDGISKSLAATGLRIGWAIGPKNFMEGVSRLQGQTTSGANSLVQRALLHLDFNLIHQYMEPIKSHLRHNAQVVREKYRDHGLAHSWYQSFSAFYYMIDFARTPLMQKYLTGPEDKTDYSPRICEDFLNDFGIAMVPGGDFGVPNSARISLVLERGPFSEVMDIIVKVLSQR